MLPRIWIALLVLVLLLLAAPAEEPSSGVMDLPSPISLCDDAAPPRTQELPAVRPPDRAARPAPRAGRVPPAPEPARVFRPPRARRG